MCVKGYFRASKPQIIYRLFTLRPTAGMPSTHSMYLNNYIQKRYQLRSSLDWTGQVMKAEPHYFASGGNADLWLGKWTKKHGDVVAVKVFKGADDPGMRMKLLEEISLWSTVQHQNILPILGISFDFDRPQTPCLISPYLRNGDITNYLKRQPAADKLDLITQLTSGLSYLHGHEIVHGNLHPSNILINDNGTACIADAGLSSIRSFNPVTTDGWRWKAPELMAACLNEEETSIPRETKAADVYSFAMIVYSVFTARRPFSHIKNDASVILSVVAGIRPKREMCCSINDEIWLVLQSCWNADPNLRPSMDTLLRFFALRQTSTAVQRARL